MIKNNPMLDSNFLKKLDKHNERELFAKVIALNFNEEPLEEIVGKVTGGGPINLDGTSAIRRTCSFTLSTNEVNITDFYWSLNTKFKLYIGLKNTIDSTYDDIIWYKMGTYILTSFSTSLNTNSFTINVSGKDKMCLLNGDVGGSLTELSTDFGTYDITDEDGEIINKSYSLKEIITEAVHHYAKEPYYNIIVEDLDDQGLELLEYRGKKNLYLFINKDTDEVANIKFGLDDTEYYQIIKKEEVTGYKFSMAKKEQKIKLDNSNFVFDSRISVDLIQEEEPTYVSFEPLKTNTLGTILTPIYTVACIEYGQTCGYRLTELVYAGDLIAAIGTSITSGVLDKIVQMLGDYEYFYDVDGIFHFQRKKLYIQKSWSNIVNNEDESYVENYAYSSLPTYSFINNSLISTYQNNPDLNGIKNDFAIWGKRTSSSGVEIPIHLRYAIDEKPKCYLTIEGKGYITLEEYTRLKEESLKNGSSSQIIDNYEIVDWREIIYQMAIDYYKYQHDDDYITSLIANNRNYYPNGTTGYEQYYIDIQGFWRELYNPKVEPIDLSTYDPSKSRKYYQWDSNLEKYIEFSFEEAVQISNIKPEKQYYYYKGIRTLKSFQNEVTSNQENLTEEEREKYLSEKKNGFTRQDILFEETAVRAIKEFYPNCEQVSEARWKEYKPYVNFTNGKYYLLKPFIDLTNFNKSTTYYTLDKDEYKSYQKYMYDKKSDGTMEKVFAFEPNKKYYQYKGLSKVSFIESNNNTDIDRNYYVKKSFIPVKSIKSNEEYYVKESNIDNTFKLAKNTNDKKITYYKLNTSQANSPSVLAGYLKVFTIAANTQYYNKDGTISKYLVRDNFYYTKDNNKIISFSKPEFIFEKGVVYYCLEGNGYEEVLDLALDADNYYIEYETGFFVSDHFSIGKKYYVYTLQDNQNIANGKYYITKDGGDTFEERNILKSFKSGYKYYTKEKGYKKVDINNYNENINYYIYDESQGYISVNQIIKEVKDKRQTLNKIQMENLNNNYGVKVDDTGKIIGLNRHFQFYSYESSFFPVNYYEFKFSEYKQATKNDINNTNEFYYKVGKKYYLTTNQINEENVDSYYVKCSPVYSSNNYYLSGIKKGWTTNLTRPEDLIFWFDFLDLSSGEMSKYSVKAIGDRPKTINDDKIKSIYYRDTPLVIFNNLDDNYVKTYIKSRQAFNSKRNQLYEKNKNNEYIKISKSENYSASKEYYRRISAEEKQSGYVYININESVENLFSISSQGKSAFDVLNTCLYEDAYCKQTITITAIPVYTLQPNTIILINDENSKIDGEYYISRISLPLQYNGTMSITATKVIDKII